MARFLAVVFGVLGLLLAFYLVALLYLIRKRGYGEGRLVELPKAGIAFRCPGWWREMAVSHGDGVDDTAYVRLRTGNHRGILTVGPVPPGGLHARRALPPGVHPDRGPSPHPASRGEEVAPPGDPPDFLASELEDFLTDKGFVFDDVQIVTGVVGPEITPSGSQAWVASNGRETPEDESRSYFEIHLVKAGDTKTVFTYTNSVLHGFLDAFYLERIMGTIARLQGPSSR